MADERRNEQMEKNENRNDYLEETAAEAVPTGAAKRVNTDEAQEDRAEPIGEDEEGIGGRGYGYFALALSILSLFFLPVVMGAAGIIIGFIARRRGAEALGGWAIGIGVAAIIISLFAAPFL